MSASLILATLVPDFRAKVIKLIDDCAANDLVVVPYFGLRTLDDQAKLWRQSRSAADIDEAIEMLNDKGASFLASVVHRVGPQPTGAWRTNALPGASWHEWGEACDLYVERDGKPIWDASDAGYRTMATFAETLGLTAGMRWKTPDTDHIQARVDASPLDSNDWPHIDAVMRSLFS